MDDVLAGLKRLTYPKDRVEFVIVDNPHPEFGSSARFIDETVIPLSGKDIPHVTLLAQKENLGFAGGNNVGIRWALEHGFDYVYFHNNDGFVAGTALEPLVKAMEADKTIGVAQSLMLLHPETELVNSAGNAFHYLGFGFCNAYRLSVTQLQWPEIKDIAYASGAALLMRVDLLKQFGLWDGDFFMYHEDLEYSLRLRMAGYRVVLVRDSVFYHKYQFARSITKFYWMERNRYGVMLMFFRWPTLLLLLPIGIPLEIGLWLFAWRGGWMEEKIKVYRYWMDIDHWKLWLGKRRQTQAIRKVTDRTLLKNAASGIYFQDQQVQNPLVTHLANPVMNVYYWLIVKGLIWW